MDNERRAAFLALKEIESEKSWSNLALGRQLKDGDTSGAFARELVFEVLRNRLLLDYNIGRFLKKPGLGLSERILLRMGFAQLCLTDSVKDHAAVNETVALAKSFAKGREGFINAVLRSFIREGKTLVFPDPGDGEDLKRLTDSLSVRYSASPGIVRLWLSSYGRERTEEMLGAGLTRAPLSLRANSLKISRDGLAEELRSQGFEAYPSDLSPYGLRAAGSGLIASEGFKNGLFSVQGEASQLAVLALAPEEGQLMLDLCAAPGGKACFAAELMKDKGRVVAFELYESRTALIKASAERLGLVSVEARAADSSVFLPEYEGRADRVLCDVPCSGLGVIRQKPEIKLADPEDLGALAALQKKILSNGLRYLKPGGRLVYSTCTVDPAENGEVVKEIISRGPGYAVEEEKQFFLSEGGPDGFYICLIRRQTC